MKKYLALFVLLNSLPLAQALANSDHASFACNPDFFFSVGNNSGTPEEFASAVNNGDPERIWFVFSALCVLHPNFDIKLTRKASAQARADTWNEVFALIGDLIHHKDQAKWIDRIKGSYGFSGGFYATSEQIIKLKASGLLETVEYNMRLSNRTPRI